MASRSAKHRPCSLNKNTFSHIFTTLFTSFFSKKKKYQIIHFLYHIIYYSNKKITTKQNFSLSNTTFSFFYINFFFKKKKKNSLKHEQCSTPRGKWPLGNVVLLTKHHHNYWAHNGLYIDYGDQKLDKCSSLRASPTNTSK